MGKTTQQAILVAFEENKKQPMTIGTLAEARQYLCDLIELEVMRAATSHTLELESRWNAEGWAPEQIEKMSEGAHQLIKAMFPIQKPIDESKLAGTEFGKEDA